MNSVNALARLVKKPELHYTANDKAVTNLYVAINNRGDDAVFVEVTVWGKSAEIVCQFVDKGDMIGITGYLKLDKWDDEHGGEREKIKIVAVPGGISFTGKPKGSGGNNRNKRPKQSNPKGNRKPKRVVPNTEDILANLGDEEEPPF